MRRSSAIRPRLPQRSAGKRRAHAKSSAVRPRLGDEGVGEGGRGRMSREEREVVPQNRLTRGMFALMARPRLVVVNVSQHIRGYSAAQRKRTRHQAHFQRSRMSKRQRRRQRCR